MSNKQTKKETKDYFQRITNSQLNAKDEMKKKMQRNTNLTQQQKQYFNNELYQTNLCEFEQHNIIENTNHMIIHCSINQDERLEMYTTIQQMLNKYKLKNKVNILHHMKPNLNDDLKKNQINENSNVQSTHQHQF